MFNKNDYIGKQAKNRLGYVGTIFDAVEWEGTVIVWVRFAGWSKSYAASRVEILEA